MSSILTNNGAMVALQTLKSINADLGKVQNEISTGKSISSAKDNAAVWAISKVMDSDVKGFKAISNSLSLGESSVAVAQNASEKITDLLTDIKGKIVNSQEENVDREKIQTDVSAMRDQINSIVKAAQFNGLNLLQINPDDASTAGINVLSSLDREGNGDVSAANINVRREDLTTRAQVYDAAGTFTAGTDVTLDDTTSEQRIQVAAPTDGMAYSIGVEITGAFDSGDFSTAQDATGAGEIVYVAGPGDTATDVARGLKAAWDDYAAENNIAAQDMNISLSGSELVVTSSRTDAANSLAVSVDEVDGDNTAGGGLAALADIDVTTGEGAERALRAVEHLIQTAIDASASFGSARGRIETQSDFISKLSDSLKSGIGAMVDADMEEASARLQALQTQQQLGIQSLSIANQAPQSILALFR